MTRSDCRASKIICNDTELEPIPWVLNIENPFLKLCVGAWVGEHRPATFCYGSKDAQ